MTFEDKKLINYEAVEEGEKKKILFLGSLGEKLPHGA
jgi:hypothetical protein